MRRFDLNGLRQSRFMAGRYGGDAFGRFLAICGFCVIILSVLTRAGSGFVSGLLGFCALALVALCYGRMLSRNIGRRQEENRRYLVKKQRFLDWVALRRDCFRQRKDYAFFRCPGCGRTVRVPRGKGRIRITCRHCGFAFEKKT